MHPNDPHPDPPGLSSPRRRFSECIPIIFLHPHIIHADEVIGPVLAPKHNAQQAVRADCLEIAASRGPDTRCKPWRRTASRDAADGSLVRVLDLEAAIVVCSGTELEIGLDGVILPHAGVQSLLQSLAALWRIGARVDRGGEGVFAAVVDGRSR